ncbi:hypothetical protein C8R41DRAFT_871689 [Lentinula lateritia]|uniref:Uncharacterized protein n=1 Tax=Lentinula lateritia TaxID=40482 RepID=A0ABQ8UYV3_9AGAR|nr:hypothetical protein C8R41DRAFT_871689 [Lentinula lateritia]
MSSRIRATTAAEKASTSAISKIDITRIELENTIKDLETSLASKDSHTETQNSTIERLETEKRWLEATAAAEKPQSEADCVAMKKFRDEAKAGKTRAGQLQGKIKDLETNLASKDLHTQTLNSTIELLETEKQRLEATAAAEKASEFVFSMAEHLVIYSFQPQSEADHAALRKLRDEAKARKTRADQLEGRIKDLETSLASKDSHTQTLNSTIESLETEKRWLEATAAAEKPQNEADRVVLKKLRDEAKAGKTRAGQLEGRIKDLETSLASKDSHTQMLNSTIQLLETEKRRLETTAAAEKPQIEADRAALKKFRDECSASHTQVLNSKIRALETEKRNLEEIAAAERPQIEADRAALSKIKRETAAGAARIRDLEQKINDLGTLPSKSKMEKLIAENALLKSSISQERNRLLTYQTDHARFDTLEKDYYHLQVCAQYLLTAKLQEKAQELVLLKQSYETERETGQLTEAQELQPLRESLAKLQAQHAEDKAANSFARASILRLQSEIETVTRERDSQVLANDSVSNLQDTITKLREQYEQEALSHSQKQGRVTALEQQESSENGPLLSQIEKLKEERDKYKDELNAQSAGHHFLSSRKNRTLSRANVNAKMRYAKKMFPSYKLVDPGVCALISVGGFDLTLVIAIFCGQLLSRVNQY